MHEDSLQSPGEELPGKPESHGSEITKKSLESSLRQLKCHFTWNLLAGENSLDDFEDRVCNQIEFQNSEFKATTYNILAFIKHHRGQNKEALECLQEAEELIRREHADRAEIRSLVTWGNYAWVYYHMGRLSEAQTYVEKVKQVCKKFSSPYRIESPILDCEEGWARLKYGGKFNERAKVCFEKALEKKPDNPEFISGLAIASYRLDNWPPSQNPTDSLRQAIKLNPDNNYAKVLLALRLQDMGKEEEGESLIEDALRKATRATDVLRGAASFYRKKGTREKTIEMLGKALECMPNNAYLHYYLGCCYRAEVIKLQSEKYGDKESLLRLIEQAVDHLKKAEEHNGNLPNIYSYLATLCAHADQYEEADYYFQKEFLKELSPGAKQLLHLRYGNFQLFQMRCEEKAIHHFLEGMKIKLRSKGKDKMKAKVQRLAEKRLFQNEADSEALYLLKVVAELDGDSERDMDSSNLLPSSSIAEAGNGEEGDGYHRAAAGGTPFD
ncbi:PREDICTED: interferon-induced protein with tetratricopeptide repeats 2 [Elephantulus edwardii]|uniref:interferon-induced protein with tetratricopeptide repeats 2 n=1 Tax=Elephantulus edwardii TaxID=28737 RepID=UPI0003F07FA7|nr:PREDICTED: interferon-induced protein with tetratricopeptide repeats 2 [Elephantulus edwardii]